MLERQVHKEECWKAEQVRRAEKIRKAEQARIAAQAHRKEEKAHGLREEEAR